MEKPYSNIVEDLAERLSNGELLPHLEDYLQEEKSSRIKNAVGLAIDRLEKAVEDAEAASANEDEDEGEEDYEGE